MLKLVLMIFFYPSYGELDSFKVIDRDGFERFDYFLFTNFSFTIL